MSKHRNCKERYILSVNCLVPDVHKKKLDDYGRNISIIMINKYS